MNGVDLRRSYESFANGDSAFETKRGEKVTGPQGFVAALRAELGLSRDEQGNPRVKDQAISPESVSFESLANACFGYEAMGRLRESQGRLWNTYEFKRTYGGTPLAYEAGGALPGALTPGDFPNVSTFLGSVTGLLEAKMLSGYQNPGYKMDRIFPVISSKSRQFKMLAPSRIGDASKKRNPGESYARAQITERYVETPITTQDALAVDVTFEAVFFQADQMNILQSAQNVGTELGLRKELECAQVLIGYTNPYNYNGTSYNTYQSATPWINTVGSGDLVDWTDLAEVRAYFSRMTDQETGNRITAQPNILFHAPARIDQVAYILNATQIERRTATAAEVAHSNAREGSYGYTPEYSEYVDQMLTSAAADGGLALTQAQADKRFWLIESRGPDNSAFAYAENWAMTTEEAAPDSYTSRNHKLVLSVFADQMGVPFVVEPRRVFMVTH